MIRRAAMRLGGAGLIASFLDAGEIDEFIIHVIPTFVGEGIPVPRAAAPKRAADLALAVQQEIHRRPRAPAVHRRAAAAAATPDGTGLTWAPIRPFWFWPRSDCSP